MTRKGVGAALFCAIDRQILSLSIVLVFGTWLILPILVAARPRPGYPTSIPIVFLLVAIGDLVMVEWLKRLVRTGVQSSGVKTAGELIALISGRSLFIASLPLGPAILGGFVYVVTGSRGWLTAFAALGLVELPLSKPSLEQYHNIVPGLSLD